MSARAAPVGLLAGWLGDRALGDPPRWHPVAGLGRIALAAERVAYRDHRWTGVVHTVALVGGLGGTAAVAHRGLRSRPGAQAALLAVTTWVALGGRSLEREAAGLAVALEGDAVEDARRRLSALCARDPAALDHAQLVRATVESVAENTADAVVGPLLWGAALGPPGVVVHRAANTLDAMVGYRTARYTRFGWASARFDDLLNWVPARLAALLTAAAAPVVGGSPAATWRVWRRDGHRHPSPNAGQVEAAFAGALGVRLGAGENRYGDHTVRQPALGDGRPPDLDDLARALRLARGIGVLAAVLGAWTAAVRGARLRGVA